MIRDAVLTNRSILNKDVTLTWINTLKLTALEVELFERTRAKPIKDVLLQTDQGVASQVDIVEVGQDWMHVLHILIHCRQVDLVEGKVQLFKSNEGFEGAEKAVVDGIAHCKQVVGQVQISRGGQFDLIREQPVDKNLSFIFAFLPHPSMEPNGLLVMEKKSTFMPTKSPTFSFVMFVSEILR